MTARACLEAVKELLIAVRSCLGAVDVLEMTAHARRLKRPLRHARGIETSAGAYYAAEYSALSFAFGLLLLVLIPVWLTPLLLINAILLTYSYVFFGFTSVGRSAEWPPGREVFSSSLINCPPCLSFSILSVLLIIFITQIVACFSMFSNVLPLCRVTQPASKLH